MSNEELLLEMESLVEGIEQALMVTIGTIAETTDPVAVLRRVLAGEQAVATEFGPNGWRDRLLRKMQLVAARKARPRASGDPALQTLIATLLTPQQDPDQTH